MKHFPKKLNICMLKSYLCIVKLIKFKIRKIKIKIYPKTVLSVTKQQVFKVI